MRDKYLYPSPDPSLVLKTIHGFVSSMISVRLFGSPQVLIDGQVTHLPRRKSRALLYYLAAHTRPLSRERLLAFFWPDLPRPGAQQSLRTTLHGLRKVLGAALVVEDKAIALAQGVEVDTRRFEAQCSALSPDALALNTALELYRGDFLADFSLPDSNEFEGWAAVERERLRRLAVRGLTSLSEIDESQGDYASALAALDRALAFDPLQEDLQREAIRLLYLAGDRPGAIRRYDQLRKLLDEEMGVPPMLETRRLYDAVINDALEKEPRAGFPVGKPISIKNDMPLGLTPGRRVFPRLAGEELRPRAELPFTGRRAEIQRIQELFQSQKFVMIEGEAGIGKTRLAEEFFQTVPALPLVGSAHELEQKLPYQPVIDALRSLLARPEWPEIRAKLDLRPVWVEEARRLLPELADELPGALRSAAFRQETFARPEIQPDSESRLWEGINQFLAGVARSMPLIFFIDDLQWADASTLSLLGYLVRQMEAQVFFLAAARAVPPLGPLASLIQTLLRLGRFTPISLVRLSPADVVEIARRLSPVYGYPLAEWLSRLSEGNPYVLAELVRFSRQEGILRPDGQVDLSALPSSPVVPQTIYHLIQTRLARLGEPARRVLDAAVAMGREFDFEVVYRAGGLSEAAALDALDELLSSGLVYPVDKSLEYGADRLYYAFDHTLTMEVAYREVGEARHQRLHRRVAETLESIYHQRLDPVSAQIAFHFVEGKAPERAAPYAFRAGRWAAGLAAWKEAAGFYAQALSTESDPTRRLEIIMALGEAHFRSGETSQASEVLHLALSSAPSASPQADRTRLLLAETLLPQARFGEAITLMQAVLAGNRPEFAVQAEFTWGTALSLEGADLEVAAEHLRRAEKLDAGHLTPAHLAQIKFEQGSIAAQQGDLPRAIDLYREALTVAEGQGSGQARDDSAVYQAVLAHNNLAYHLHLLGDPVSMVAALQHAQKGLKLAQEKGILNLQPYLVSTLGEIALAGGDLDAAEHSFKEGLALAERLSMPERIAGLTANLGLVARRRSQNDLAIHYLSTALAEAQNLGTHHQVAQIHLWLAPLLPPQEARRHLAEARAIAGRSGRRRLLEEADRLENSLPGSGQS